MAHIKSAVNISRISTVLFGILVMSVGLTAHFTSGWRNYYGVKLYEICEEPVLWSPRGAFGSLFEKPCPPISLEHYYVTVIIMCFSLSFIGLFTAFLTDVTAGPLKILDLGYHIIFAVLLVAAGISIIVSAAQIRNNIEPMETIVLRFFRTRFPLIFPPEIDENQFTFDMLPGFNFRTGGKFAAGVLAFIEAILYGTTAFFIAIQ